MYILVLFLYYIVCFSPADNIIIYTHVYTYIDIYCFTGFWLVEDASLFCFSVTSMGLAKRFVGNKFMQFVHNNDLSQFQKYADTGELFTSIVDILY